MQTAAAENTQDYSDDLTESINAFTKKLYQVTLLIDIVHVTIGMVAYL